MFLFHPPIFFSMAETNKQKEEGKKQRPPRTLVSLLYVNERCVNLFLLPHPPPKCWAKLLRCFIVPHASGFPYSLCGTVSRASTVFSCRHHTATHRGTLILTLPSLLHKLQLCDYVHKQAAHTHTRYWFLATVLSKLWGLLETLNLTIIIPGHIKVPCKQLFSRKYFPYEDIQWEKE